MNYSDLAYGIPRNQLRYELGIKRCDIIILVVSILLWICLFVSGDDQGDNVKAVVYSSGQLVYEKSLSQIDEDEQITKDFNGVKIVFTSEGVWVEESTCPNQLCVKQSSINIDGEAIACIPQRVVVSLESETTDIDIVTY